MTANFMADAAASVLLDARGDIGPAKDGSETAAARVPDKDSFATLVMGRRSIRRYRPEPVETALVERVLAQSTWAPSARR